MNIYIKIFILKRLNIYNHLLKGNGYTCFLTNLSFFLFTRIPKLSNVCPLRTTQYAVFSIFVEMLQILQEHMLMRMEQPASNPIWSGVHLLLIYWASEKKQDSLFPPARQTSELTVQGRGSTLFWSQRCPPVGGYWDASPWGDESQRTGQRERRTQRWRESDVKSLHHSFCWDLLM